MKILAIIVSYNFMPWMDRCIPSLLHSAQPVDILVLDNGSRDATVQTLMERYPQVEVVENKANLGFGKANNIGLHKAVREHYDGVFLLNQDAWVDSNVIGGLAELSQRHPDFGILSPVHLTGSGEKIEHGFRVYVGVADKEQLPEGDIVGVPFIDAAIWYLPVAVLERVGFFAPLFYHYGEDKDICNRMAFHGYKIGYCPTLFGYHDREFRQVDRAARMRSERVYFLSEFANINYSLGHAFAMSVLAACKKSLTSLLHLRIRDCLTYLFMALGLTFRYDDVIKSREICMHVDLRNFV